MGERADEAAAARMPSQADEQPAEAPRQDGLPQDRRSADASDSDGSAAADHSPGDDQSAAAADAEALEDREEPPAAPSRWSARRKRGARGPLPPSTSDLLVALTPRDPEERMVLADLLRRLEHRAFGFGMLLCALPNMIPIPIPTGLSTVFGIPLALICWQMLIGLNAPRLPEWVGNRSIAGGDYQRMVSVCLPYLKKVERLTKPRWPLLMSPMGLRCIGAVGLLLAAILIMPIPLGNLLPAFAVGFAALGLLEQDGALVAVSGVIAGIATVVVGLVLTGGFLALDALWRWAISGGAPA